MAKRADGKRDVLERPWVSLALKRELAVQTVTQRELAKKYDVTEAAISSFKKRHADAIQEMRDDAENEFAGIWIARKADRLEAYRMLWEKAFDEDDHALCSKIEKQVAEEMGHLPGRVTISGQLDTQTRYTIDGVNPEDLR